MCTTPFDSELSVLWTTLPASPQGSQELGEVLRRTGSPCQPCSSCILWPHPPAGNPSASLLPNPELPGLPQGSTQTSS